MLNLTCNAVSRSRPLTGGLRFTLQPLDAQSVLTDDVPTGSPDLGRAYVTVYDYAASQHALRDERIDPKDMVGAEIGGSIVLLDTSGAMYVSVFLSERAHSDFISDLTAALEIDHLLASLVVGPELDYSDRLALQEWLKGTRFDQPHRIRVSRTPEIALVLRK